MAQHFADFADQSHRLLRQDWKSATSLSQEIYAMLAATPGDSQPAQVQVPEHVQARLQAAKDKLAIS